MSNENKLLDGAKKSSIMNWVKKHKILTAIIIIFVIGLIGSAMGEDKSTNNNIVANPEANKPEEKQPVQEPEKPKTWTSVYKVTANSDKQTENFSLDGGQQKIVYKTTGNSSLCYVYVLKEGATLDKNGGMPVVSIDGEQADETMMRKSDGNYYLDIKTVNGSCQIEVQELK
ncbi:MAG TPA: hypothetical protein PK526_03120 [bacterium]|mgnify:CR=1 FL=1|nr:hypothetical protein [bacterium]